MTPYTMLGGVGLTFLGVNAMFAAVVDVGAIRRRFHPRQWRSTTSVNPILLAGRRRNDTRFGGPRTGSDAPWHHLAGAGP